MTEKKDSIAISLLKQEWDIYSKNHKVTQAQASKKLGWSSSFFGSLLRGTSSVGVENQIKIANLFGIDPHKLNPETNVPLLPAFQFTARLLENLLRLTLSCSLFLILIGFAFGLMKSYWSWLVGDMTEKRGR